MIVPDKIYRSKRKALSISVDATGRLIVRAPLRCSEARIIAFIEKKSAWILKQKSKFNGVSEFLPKENLDGFAFSFFGRSVTLRVGEGKRTVFNQKENQLTIPKSTNEETVQKWLKTNAKRYFTAMTELRAREMNASYKAVLVSSAKRRWGACSADNTLRFTFRLAFAPTAVIDYVVIHELAHTFYKNHGKLFWAKVAEFCPDWKIKRKWLKDHGYLMQIF